MITVEKFLEDYPALDFNPEGLIDGTELHQIGLVLNESAQKVATRWGCGIPEVTLLGAYCTLRALAMGNRLRGFIESARVLEVQCDKIWMSLPSYLKW